MQNAECKMQNAELGMRSAECGVRNAECGVGFVKIDELELQSVLQVLIEQVAFELYANVFGHEKFKKISHKFTIFLVEKC